jgi:hypothetical protein
MNRRIFEYCDRACAVAIRFFERLPDGFMAG